MPTPSYLRIATIDGTYGSGRATQARELAKAFRSIGVPALAISRWDIEQAILLKPWMLMHAGTRAASRRNTDTEIALLRRHVTNLSEAELVALAREHRLSLTAGIPHWNNDIALATAKIRLNTADLVGRIAQYPLVRCFVTELIERQVEQFRDECEGQDTTGWVIIAGYGVTSDFPDAAVSFVLEVSAAEAAIRKECVKRTVLDLDRMGCTAPPSRLPGQSVTVDVVTTGKSIRAVCDELITALVQKPSWRTGYAELLPFAHFRS
ncbi:MAG TPA: hypothetical protein VMS08_01315 [Candidatus Saccharimonadia bacterium]|nr:hypothetical protein [Candidatus Saccharimonadia bacterium]